MRALIAAIAFGVIAAGIGLAYAVPPGFSLEFEGGGQGKVIFQGKVHSGSGMDCSDCHMAVFYAGRASQITVMDHNRKQYCFTCHNGEVAFAAISDCAKCHRQETGAATN
jgi:phosphate transport system substrate-binding protein